jgi:hypothetical protein
VQPSFSSHTGGGKYPYGIGMGGGMGIIHPPGNGCGDAKPIGGCAPGHMNPEGCSIGGGAIPKAPPISIGCGMGGIGYVIWGAPKEEGYGGWEGNWAAIIIPPVFGSPE